MEATPPAVPSYEAAPFGVGTILSRAWRTLFSHPALFLGLAALSTAPDLVYEIVFQKSSGIPFSHLLTLMIQGAIAYGVFKITRSEPVSMGEALSRGARRLFTLFILSLIEGLCVVLGLVLLVIPGLIMLCMFAVSIPACAVERLGAIDSMKRSAELTRGRRWTIFAVFLIAMGVLVVTAGVMGVVAALLFPDSSLLQSLFLYPVVLGWGTFFNVMPAIIYYDLRAAKDGVSVASLANVFD